MKKFTTLFIIAVIFCFKPILINAQVDVNDSLALVALYNNTDGVHWFNHTNWLTAEPVSIWYGITVTGNRVTHIRLDQNKLKGNIPGKLGNLTNLHVLSISQNKLRNGIPQELGNLLNLETLIIAFNPDLKGKIPYSLGQLTNLDTLILSSDSLSGTIPVSIGNLVKLKSLDLFSNSLSGNIPKTIGNLTNLTDLGLAWNQLTGEIPSTISNLLNLIYLRLDFNHLTGTIPFSLGRLTKVSMFSLDNNQLSGAIPGSLDSLPERARIFLGDNAFTFSGLGKLIKSHSKVACFPQAGINLNNNGGIFSVNAGGMLSDNTYKWYKNNILAATIKGDSTYQPTESGEYYVIVGNFTVPRLKLYSDTINYNAGANSIAAQINHNNISLCAYPNPAKSNTTVLFNAEGKYTITVSDILGKKLQIKTGISNKEQNIVKLDVSKYTSGIYLITITDEKSNKQTIKFNKE